ncbi:MAG TPA: PBSX family phage terminase large subunit [Acetobacteraceae bacterium]|nr:PBSX family phage terminase large subunit [Acetobacteraceae bacterium]
MSTLRVQVPRKLKSLLLPKRYKGAYGGRGGAKSHFFAEQIVLRCLMRPTRVVCIREVQSSIKDSVRQLLVDKIEKLGVGSMFEVLDNEIRGPQGSLIVFKGMQSYNATNIKSLEAYDIAWVEEAQTFTQHSLDLLRPTLRKEGSELWFSWNPRFKTDPVDQFFRRNPPPDAVSVLINWRDNPWFPDVLRREMLHDFATDEDKAEHIWNGAYGNSQGAILARLVNAAERAGRISDEIVYDPLGAPIEVSSDIGFRDTASWWYWQRVQGGFHLLKYEGESGYDADDWIPIIGKNIEAMGAKLGQIWLPHDARAKTFQSKHTTAEKFLESFGGGKVSVVPQSKKMDQISAARSVLPKCAFNETACEHGLDGLRAWEYEYDEENGVFSREPLHNWASHPADGFCYGAQVMSDAEYIKPAQEPDWEHLDTRETLNDVWADHMRQVSNHRRL